MSAENNKHKDNCGKSDGLVHDDEIIEEPDYGLDEEEEDHHHNHHLKTDTSIIKNSITDISQSSNKDSMAIEGLEADG